MKQTCKNLGNIKSIQVINQSDIVYEDGKLRMKRKYGKFKREVYNLDLKKLNQTTKENINRNQKHI
jgi:hypothetical protein